ncbi:MAG: copper-binding protein, partial [Caulobacter sp.]
GPGGPPPGGGGPGGPGGGGKQTDLTKVVITGVVMAVDPAADRVTIAYAASEPLNWPAGTMPFATAKPGMLGDIGVGRKVRFTLSNHRIAAFLPDEEGPGGPPPEGGPPPGGPDGKPGGPPPADGSDRPPR